MQRLCLPILVTLSVAHGQWVPERADREYGIGIATTKSPYSVPLFFSERPSTSSAKIAYFHNDTLVFLKSRDTVRSFDKMIEVSYEEIGFPILSYSADSQWVKVTLDCHEFKHPPLAWIHTRTNGLIVRSWTQMFNRTGPFFFIKGEWRKFYSTPALESQVHPTLYKRKSAPNYFMYRRAIKGRWMQVDLETPASFMRSNEEVIQEFGVPPKRQTVWIQFLDERLRPRIFYPTRG